MGHAPDTVDVEAVPGIIATARARQTLALLGRKTIAFIEKEQLLMYRREVMAEHPNGADMKTKYKETSRGGLTVNIVEC